jgi:LacI family transcriptional regulator
VVNGHPNISTEVRERVQRVIHEQNFMPNTAARTLVTRRTRSIGLLIPTSVPRFFSDTYFSLLMQGIAEMCERYDYYVTLILVPTPTNKDMARRRILANGFFDGVIVSSATMGDPLLSLLRDSKIQCVLVGHYPEVTELPWVSVDNHSGSFAATNYLIQLGHRRIATITGPLDTTVGQHRLEGYRRALTESNIPYDPSLIREGDFTTESGAKAMRELIEAHPTAIFAASDAMAFGAIRILNQNHLGVPEDVSVVGFDAFPNPYDSPSLTSVTNPAIELGRTAAQMLLEKLDAKYRKIEFATLSNSNKLLETKLVIRQTTCKARNEG